MLGYDIGPDIGYSLKAMACSSSLSENSYLKISEKFIFAVHAFKIFVVQLIWFILKKSVCSIQFWLSFEIFMNFVILSY